MKKNGQSNVGTKKQVDCGKILALYRAHWPIEEIAADVRCDAGTVCQVLRAAYAK